MRVSTPRIARTVTGDIPIADLGITMCHEHLLVDQRTVTFSEPEDRRDLQLARRPVTLDIFGWVQWNWTHNLDNLVLDDESIAIEEATAYRMAGGQTLVDCTLPGIGRDPDALCRIAKASGIILIMGAGYYVEGTYPPHVPNMTEQAITDEILADFRSGVGPSRIRAGVIGEIGSSWPMTDTERKVFRAAGAAQAELDCGLTIHPGRHPDSPMEILEILRDAGADLSRVIMGHIERTVRNTDLLRTIAAEGCYVQYDLFGTETTAKFPYRKFRIDIPSDAQRLDQIKELVESGLEDRILVGHDVGSKHRTRRYGGLGFDHFLRDIVPWMPERGFADATIQKLTVGNPGRALSMPSDDARVHSAAAM
jgi:phosphotriesterase-related protein